MPRGRTKPPGLTPEEIAFARSLVMFEDDDILVVDKPPGLSSQGGGRDVHSLDELLGAFAKSSGSRPRLIHRLDRDTSGVLLTAKTQPSAAFLGKAMMGRRVRKTYLAVVAPGGLDPREGAVETGLLREDHGRESFVRVAAPEERGAQAAVTRYRTLAANDAGALVELSPRTGRMHQLRVHMASLGHPIAGDPRYGGAMVVGGAAAPRLMLHAAGLAFPHPAGGERRIEAPVPEDMRGLLAALGLAIPDRWNATAPVALDQQGTPLVWRPPAPCPQD
jgi:tRNA pseudouridine32 synthase/23S rRNA pseudouridine746 synthase